MMPARVTQLCETCRGVFESNPDEKVEYPHHESVEAFRNAKEAGCQLCNTIWDRINKDSDTFRIKWFMTKIYSHPPLLLSFSSKVGIDDPDVGLCVGPFDEPEEPLESHCPGDNTNSEATWSLISRWLNSCVSEHNDCRQPEVSQPEGSFPDRVIDVGTHGEYTIRLRCAKDMKAYERQSRYLTLSHRWSNQLFQLTTDTVSDLRNGLPISRLPKTFQDAIEATRQLQERFLWIDSLCIFQDSVVDWTQQSAKMGDIYLNCYCNLAATAAPDPNGLFFDRNITTILPIKMSCNWTFPELSNEEEGDEASPDEICQVYDYTLLERAVEDTCLNSRGWVLQERLLSPRVVHFGRNQIFWECWSLRACETYPDGDPNMLQEIVDSSHFWPAKQFVNAIRSRTVPIAYEEWRALVELYTRTSLTKPGDTLVALSGVAKMMQKATKDEYVAGLWKENLAHDLLWERVGEINLRPKDPGAPDAWIAPSWSWASSGYMIAYDQWQALVELAADLHITFLESHVVVNTSDLEGEIPPMEHQMRKFPLNWFRKMLSCFGTSAGRERSSEPPASPDVTGQIREASLHLKARIFELPCTKNKRFGLVVQTARSCSIIEVVLDGETYPAWIVYDDPDTQSIFFGIRNAIPRSYGQLQFMPTIYNRLEAYGNRWYGLLLENSDQPDQYRRIGRLEILISLEKVRKALQRADEGAEVRFVEPDLEWLYMLRDLRPSSGERDENASGRERTVVLL